MPDDVWILRAPRLNANDDIVTLTRWIVPDRASVRAGEAIAEIETEKATAELAADARGILVQAVAAGAAVPIGSVLAYVGDPTAIEAARAMQIASGAPTRNDGSKVTAKASALAEASGLDLAHVSASGDTIKERDVARHLAGRAVTVDSIGDDPRLTLIGNVSVHQIRIARDLRAAAQAGIFTTLAYRLDLRGAERMIAAELADGRAASLLAILLHALGKTLPHFASLRSVHDGGKLYRYRDIDIAFAARSPAGDLHAPVVRQSDRLSLQDIARECVRLAKSAMRGKLAAADVGGACFTVSLVPTPNVESFVALPVPRQSAILALGARREEIQLTAGGVAGRPVATATITYDHAVSDGVEIAQFCEALNRALNPEHA